MRKLLFFCFLLFSSFLFANPVTNVRAMQEGKKIVLLYDMAETAYVADVEIRVDGASRVLPLNTLSGDVGREVAAGPNRRIEYDLLLDYVDGLRSDNISFVIKISRVYASNTKISTTNNNSVDTLQIGSTETINQNRVRRLISDISKYSSKGGDYVKLENYFTDIIIPHPSKEVRYRNNIASKTQKFVERYSMYEISEPYDFVFVNNSFPLQVECNVYVTWIYKGQKKRATIHKIYYITSDYRVSGFIDKELDRTTLSY